MKKNYLLSFCLILVFTGLFTVLNSIDASAQIKIGNNGTNIAPASLLELESTDKGLLIPRMPNTTAIDALNPPVGMLIYITTEPSGIYIKKAAGWEYLTGFLGGNAFFNSLTVTGAVNAGSFSGPLNGNATSANTAINATNALNATIINDLSTPQPVYPTFVLATSGNSQIRTATTKLSFVPNTGILTATGFSGPLTGDVTGNATSATNATNASNTDILNEVASPAVHYPTFVTATSGNLPHLVSNSGFTFIPATGTLTATQFSGSLLGNASTATVATNATNSANVAVSNDVSTTGFNFPVFAGATTGNQALKTGNALLRYRPSTGELFAGTFVGPLTGNVTGSATSATNATNATNIGVTADVSATPMFPLFATATNGTLPAMANGGLRFVPSTGTLTASTFVGNLTGNATTATSTPTATNANNVAITEDITTGTDVFPVFANASSGNQPLHTTSPYLKIQPSTGRLTAGSFVGPLTGNVTGNATSADDADNAVNIGVTASTANATMYPAFVSNTSGQFPANVSSTLTFNPQTGALGTTTVTATTFNGALAGNATSATSVTGLVTADHGGTGHNTYTIGDLLYASGPTTLSRLAPTTLNQVLRLGPGNIPEWSSAGSGTVTSVSGTPNSITISSDPTTTPVVSVSGTYPGNTNITTLGTISTGTWQGNPVATQYGGIGSSGFPIGNILIGAGANTNLNSVTPGANGTVLVSNGPGAPPSFEIRGAGDMVLNTPQTVPTIGAKTFGNGALLLEGSGTGTMSLVTNSSTIGTATFPQGTYDVVTTNTTQTITGTKTLTAPTFTGNTTFNTATGTSLSTTGGIIATGGFTGNLTGNVTGNVTGNASSATVFTTALTGEVTGGNSPATTQVASIGSYNRVALLGLLDDVAAATQANVNNAIVQRNASGDFVAGTISAALAGNATTATTLQTGRLIYGNTFNGGADVTGVIASNFGGTGVNNAGNTITVNGNLSHLGNFPQIIRATNNTDVTLPIAGTLYSNDPGSITSLSLAGALTDETGSIGGGVAVFSNSPVLVTPNLGTPSTLVGTNITGTAAGLTAGAVTTNANLTGAVTSSGSNTTVLGSFTSADLAGAVTGETGTGAAVFAISPAFTTPNIGVATATSVNGNAITASTGSTLTLAANSSLITSGASPITLTSTGPTNVTLPTSTPLGSTLIAGLSGSAPLDFPSTPNGTSSVLTITVAGAIDGDPVSLGVPNVLMISELHVYTAWVSAANTVTVRYFNNTGAPVDPSGETFKVKVFK